MEQGQISPGLQPAAHASEQHRCSTPHHYIVIRHSPAHPPTHRGATDADHHQRGARTLPPDAADSPLRGADRLALQPGPDDGHRPPLDRPGSLRGRRRRRGTARRLRRQHPPRARASPGEGRADRPAAGRDLRARDRLLSRQGRLAAYRGARILNFLGTNGITGGGHAGRDRRGPLGQVAPQRPGRPLLLRRRRGECGRVPRSAEYGGGLAAADRLHLREQRLRDVDRRLRAPRASPTSAPAPQATGSPA